METARQDCEGENSRQGELGNLGGASGSAFAHLTSSVLFQHRPIEVASVRTYTKEPALIPKEKHDALVNQALEALASSVNQGLGKQGALIKQQGTLVNQGLENLGAKVDNLSKRDGAILAAIGKASRRTTLMVIASTVAVVVAVVAYSNSRFHGVVVPGLTRGADSVAEETARTGKQGGGWSWNTPIDGPGIEFGTGEQNGHPMPHTPLRVRPLRLVGALRKRFTARAG